MPTKVAINWGVSNFHGWGVYGLNLALNWAGDPDLQAMCAKPTPPEAIQVDPLRRLKLEPFIAATAQLDAALARFAGGAATLDAVVLDGVGPSFEPTRATREVALKGRPSLAVTFFEFAPMPADVLARARAYPMIVTGCTWNERVLRAHGLDNVRTVLQGVDPTLFHPAPAAGVMGDRFKVFSGGKPELRKGQDIALAAFRIFAERHPDALLVTAWHTSWPDLARPLAASGQVAPLVLDAAGALDVPGWVQASGVPARQHLDLGQVHNAALPQVLREMDVAVFTNRSEGGTNLVAMECMACGVPTILSANTGHLDLIGTDNCFMLERQAPLGGIAAGVGDVPGWGESDLDEVVETLELAYADPADARRRGLRGAETLKALPWSRTAAEMKQVILDVAGR